MGFRMLTSRFSPEASPRTSSRNQPCQAADLLEWSSMELRIPRYLHPQHYDVRQTPHFPCCPIPLQPRISNCLFRWRRLEAWLLLDSVCCLHRERKREIATRTRGLVWPSWQGCVCRHASRSGAQSSATCVFRSWLSENDTELGTMDT